MKRRIVLSLGLVGLMICGSASMPAQTGEAGAAPQAVPKGPIGSEDNPMRVSGGVMAGLILNKVEPDYPQEARDSKVSGTIVLMAKVDKNGKVADLKVVSGPEILRTAALDAVRQWTYKPYQLNGRPMFVQTTVTVTFSLTP